MSEYLSLNPEQKRAVEAIDGPVLIIAGAGAGKTKVLTHRILNIVKMGVAPRDILAITFTNKAATEMRERVGHLLGSDMSINRPIQSIERPFVSTFHALGVFIIRENSQILGLPKHFNIYDRGDAKRAMKDAMMQCSLDPKTHDPFSLLNSISRAKGEGMDRNKYAESARDHKEELVARVWEAYERIARADKSLDFDDLLLLAYKILSENPDILKKYSDRWKYMHIDEYQDTNHIQYKTARLLAQAHRNICVVGDIDQNIYSWRGATIENIMNFEKDYPEATVITLEKNYRSTKTILAAANSVIEKNKQRRKKNLYTDNDHGEKISMNVLYTELDEARYVTDTACELINSGVSPQNIAVLYRANFQSRVLEDACIKKNIPYKLAGTKFFERKEIKDVLAYIRAAIQGRESPIWGDVARIINVPARGIGKVSLLKIMTGKEKELSGSVRGKLESFWNILDSINKQSKTAKPSELVKFVIQVSGIERSYSPQHEYVFDEDVNGNSSKENDEERLLNVRELVSMAAQYDNVIGEDGIQAFLTNVALYSDQDNIKETDDAIRLMTVHSAKGLEFDYVFIVGMEEDLFPFKHMGEEDISSRESEEERRLFYVALTRAKKKLYLSHVILRTIFGAQRIAEPSEFLADIDINLIESVEKTKPSGAKAIFIDF